MEKKLLLQNARVVLPDRTAGAVTLQLEEGRITRIDDAGVDAAADDAAVLNLAGLTLFPGFIDIHIHGAAGVDTMAAGPADLTRVSEFLVANGVTAWLPTLVPAAPEQYRQAVSTISELVDQTSPKTKQARILGVHYEGPFVNSEQCGALHREHFRAFSTAADVASLPVIDHPHAVHFMTLAPEVEGGIELIKELRRRGWIVSIGHTRATAHVLDQALAAGALHMTHFMNAMTPLHHRDVGAVGWGLTNDKVSLDLIADGIHINPAILRFIVGSKSPERVSLISDAIAATGQGDGDYEIWGERISVKDGRTANVRGSIAGSVITMLDAVRTLALLGFSETEVARMASLNPARVLGIEKECGSIEAGKRADLVALDRDFNVRLTIVGGQIAFQS